MTKRRTKALVEVVACHLMPLLLGEGLALQEGRLAVEAGGLFSLTLNLDQRLETRKFACEIDLSILRPSGMGPFSHEEACLKEMAGEWMNETNKYSSTYPGVPLAGVLLVERIVPDGLEDVVQHQVGGGEQLGLSVA
jgi:hypothetical protein